MTLCVCIDLCIYMQIVCHAVCQPSTNFRSQEKLKAGQCESVASEIYKKNNIFFYPIAHLLDFNQILNGCELKKKFVLYHVVCFRFSETVVWTVKQEK